jgi:hypothetical protein
MSESKNHRRRLWPLILIRITIATAIFLPFQNCSLVGFTTAPKSASHTQKGGEGFDGKTFPDASNTGVPAGVTLSPSAGDISLNTAGAVIDGAELTGSVTISADNVTIRNSKITSKAYTAVKIADGVSGAIVEDCEIRGNGAETEGIRGHGAFKRNNIYATTVGIVVSADSLVQDNYIHDLAGLSSSTYNGITADGGYSNLVIRHNTVINDKKMNAAVMLDTYYGPITGALVEDNRLSGGGYTIYVVGSNYPLSGAIVRNNRLVKGVWDYKDVQGNTPVWTGNVDDITGAPIP